MLTPSIVVPQIYASLPIVATGIAIWRARRIKDVAIIRELIVTCIAGAVGGLALASIYMQNVNGYVPATQVVITCYWGISVACLLRGFSTLLAWGARRAIPSRMDLSKRQWIVGVEVSIVRAAVLLGAVIPYVGAMVLTYRPHVVHPGTPSSILAMDYQEVAFTATDGMKLRGWWIPSVRTENTDETHPPAAWGENTVVLCHGFGADKASQLRLVRDLAPNGYNVLAFDFRAHGESSGQFTSFGDIERRDVLGAVRWIRKNHPNESRKVFGVGESLGAAALICAAGDPSAEGQAIDAVAVFAPFDQLTGLMQDVADAHFVPTAGWMATHLALPVAGAQVGAPLTRFEPGAEVDKIAPRPLLVIATDQDHTIDSARSQNLYERASQPKYGYWIKKGTREGMLFRNENASLALRIFFESARDIL
jgi:alpha-beta hydrolase superfamily lysophospholipase